MGILDFIHPLYNSQSFKPGSEKPPAGDRPWVASLPRPLCWTLKAAFCFLSQAVLEPAWGVWVQRS